jgi:hypothetical protein
MKISIKIESNAILLAIVALFGNWIEPAYSRAAPRSGVLECRGIIEHSPYSNPGFYQIDDSDPCHIDGHTESGKAILAVCHEGDMCKLKAYGTWAVDFYVKRVISVQKLPGR